jgi:uncharacterized protein YcbK (DUF882 family)
VPAPIASQLRLSGPASRGGLRIALAATALILGCQALQDAVADGDTRTISMHHLHTKEDITVTFKRNGRYDETALKQLNWFLRDWRENNETRMDPRILDLIWEVNREVGGTQPIQIICGYRGESTNMMLRRRTNGVAQNSLHKSGQAMDFAIPGVPLEKLRVAGLRLQRGGVGFYPSSGSPFIHMDIGGVRHWPRMSREQLARVFPDGRTVHIPADGQPLAGYAVALAEIERHGSSPSSMSLAAAQRAGIDTDTTASTGKPQRSLLARIFGTNEADEAEEATPQIPAPVRVAAVARPPAEPVPLPKVRPADAPIVVAMALPPTARAVARAPLPNMADPAAGPLSPNEIIRVRGYWVGVPDMNPAATEATVAFAARLAVVSDPVATGTTPASNHQRLAYAAEPARDTTGRVPPRTVIMRSARAATSIAVKASVPIPPPSNPWLNAVTITPSVWTHLSATQYGARDFHSLRPYLDKPASTLAIGFSQDPHRGLSAERFSGRAIVFVGTVSFAAAAGDGHMQTAALR